MRLFEFAFVASTFAGILFTDIAAPQVRKSYVTNVDFEMTDQNLKLAIFKIDFDQDIFFKKVGNDTLIPMSKMLKLVSAGNMQFPALTIAGQGSVQLTCGNSTIQSNLGVSANVLLFKRQGGQQSGQQGNQQGDQQGNQQGGGGGGGPPSAYMVAPPTRDPLASFLNLIFEGIKLTEEFLPNRLAIAYIIDDSWLQTDRLKSCKIKIAQNSSYSIVGKDDPVNLEFNIPYEPPKCEYEDVLAMNDAARKTLEVANNVNTLEELSSLSNLLDSLSARESYTGCKREIGSWLKFKDVNVTIEGDKNCQFRYEDPNWALDPCCNQELLQKQCCKPRSVTFPVKSVDSLNSTIIAEKCKNPTKIGSLLTNMIDALKGQSQKPYRLSDEFQSVGSFWSTCSQAVFSTSCTADSDCIYSGSCDQNGKCYVDYTNPAPPLIKCALASMSEELKLEFKYLLNVPTKFDDPSLEVSFMVNKILEIASTEDCVGPNAEQFRKKVEYKQVDGEWKRFEKTGNKTGCLADKECSFEPWTRDTEQKCTVDAAYRTGFCAQTSNGFARPLSYFSQCSVRDVSQQYCTTNLGVWDSFQNTCNFPTKNTETLCLNGIGCKSDSTEPWRCSQTVCVFASTPQLECNGTKYWHYWLKKCILNNWNNNQQVTITADACVAAGGTFHPSTNFQAGRFDSKEKCPSTSCDNWEVINAGGDEASCKAKGYCSSSCPRCSSGKYDDGVCLKTAASNKNQCETAGGKWEQNACVSSSTKAGCTETGDAWVDCNNFSKSTCTSSSFQNVMNCRWSDYNSCKNSTQCASASYCDDFEFGNGQVTGRCVYLPTEPYKCKSDQSTRTGECILRNVTQSSQCNRPNWTWRNRANTAEECKKQGTVCILPDGFRNNMNETTCTSCGGMTEGVYSWVTPRWIYGNLVKTEWLNITMSPRNKWVNALDFEKMNELFNQAMARSFSRVLINRFADKFSIFSSIFETASCDCLSSKDKCFDTVIASRIAGCKADPSSTSTCSGLTITASTFPNGTAVNIVVNQVSGATFVKEGSTAKRSLEKRAVQAQYEVVQNRDGTTIGQIVGNAKQFVFDVAAISDVSICLDVDSNIGQDTTKYPIRDFAKSTGGTLGVPFGRTVTLNGTQFCGTVPPFKDATFIAVLRKEVTLIYPTATTTATPTKNPNSAQKNGYFVVFFATIFSLLAF